jgi:hypothetical protein
MNYKYEVALSFAGEDRSFAEAVAEGLQEQGIAVFYDNYEPEQLWGEDLSIKLREIYHSMSRYCIMIVSQHYINKMWPNYERQQSIERLIEQRGSGYILPVRLDGYEGEIPGLSKLIGYLPASSNNPEKVVNAFLKKIGKNTREESGTPQIQPSKPFIPKIKKSFTDKEKNQFLRDSFHQIVSLIDHFALETHKKYPHFEHDQERITPRKVIFAFYSQGKELTRFKLWVGDLMGRDSIYLQHGTRMGMESDNSFNESISLEEHEGQLKLKPLGMLNFGAERNKLMASNDVAEYIWGIVSRGFS